MKKTLHLIILVFVMLFAASTLQAQTWTENGKYKISVPGQDLFMTINGTTGALEWAAELPNNDPTQVWTITDHRTPASSGLLEITANIPGVGIFTMATAGVQEDHPNYTIIVRPGEPISVEVGAEDYSGLDQFQRRKTSASVEGNDALFIKTPWGTNSRYGVIPTAVGESVQFDGAGIDPLYFTFIEGLPTAIGDDVSVFDNYVFPNPSDNGIFNLKESTTWSVYSISGSVVAEGEGQLVDISSYPKGMYILKFDGLTEKIVF